MAVQSASEKQLSWEASLNRFNFVASTLREWGYPDARIAHELGATVTAIHQAIGVGNSAPWSGGLGAACFECGEEAYNDHHVVPQVRGGTETVPLCLDCHGKAHGRRMSNSALTKAGLGRAKAAGKKWWNHPSFIAGRKRGAAKGQPKASEAAAAKRRAAQAEHCAPFIYKVVAWREFGLSYDAIAARLNEQGQVSVKGGAYNASTVRRMLLNHAASVSSANRESADDKQP
jgi:hypothetical protein